MEQKIFDYVAGRKEPDFFKCPEDAELMSVHEDVRRYIESATETLSVELDEGLKIKAEAGMAAIGWTLEEALILFLYWCISDPDRAKCWAKAQLEGDGPAFHAGLSNHDNCN